MTDLPPPPPPAPPSFAPAQRPADRGVRLLIPVRVSAGAMAAGYLGLFALLLLPAPVALVVGLIALRDLAKRPDMRGKGRAWFGVIMGAIGTTILGTVGILIVTGH